MSRNRRMNAQRFRKLRFRQMKDAQAFFEDIYGRPEEMEWVEPEPKKEPTKYERIEGMKNNLRAMTHEQRLAELNSLSQKYRAHLALWNEDEIVVYGMTVAWLELIVSSERKDMTTEISDLPKGMQW